MYKNDFDNTPHLLSDDFFQVIFSTMGREGVNNQTNAERCVCLFCLYFEACKHLYDSYDIFLKPAFGLCVPPLEKLSSEIRPSRCYYSGVYSSTVHSKRLGKRGLYSTAKGVLSGPSVSDYEYTYAAHQLRNRCAIVFIFIFYKYSSRRTDHDVDNLERNLPV